MKWGGVALARKIVQKTCRQRSALTIQLRLHLPGVVPIPTLPLGSEPTRDPAPALITRPPRAATLPPAHPSPLPSPAAPRVPRPAWIALRSRGPSPPSPSHDTPSPAACGIAPRTASHAGLPGAGNSLPREPAGNREAETKAVKYPCSAQAAPSPADPLTRSLGDYPGPLHRGAAVRAVPLTGVCGATGERAQRGSSSGSGTGRGGGRPPGTGALSVPFSRFGAGGKFVPVSPPRGEPGALIAVGSRTGIGEGCVSVPTGCG